MATVIRTARETGRAVSLPECLLRALPSRLTSELREAMGWGRAIEELRLRRGRRASLTMGGRNLPLRCVMTGEEMTELVTRLCDGALYAHRDTIARGFLTLEGGIRVGICGRASVEGESIVGVYDISGLNFRLPTLRGRPGEEICRLLETSRGGGVLIYAPPGEGKTTLLRGVAARMASGETPRRVVVVDTRGELGASLEDPSLCLDLLVGYPRGIGIEIATRTMNAQLIVCDEIGGESEAAAILSAQNCGVPLVASAHGESVGGLLRRRGLRLLHEARVFDAYVGIRRLPTGGEFSYRVTSWEEACREL